MEAARTVVDGKARPTVAVLGNAVLSLSLFEARFLSARTCL